MKHYGCSCMQELNAAFIAEAENSVKDRLLLTAAVAAGKNAIDNGYEVESISRYGVKNVV